MKDHIIELTSPEVLFLLARHASQVLSGHPVPFWIPRSSREMTGFEMAMSSLF